MSDEILEEFNAEYISNFIEAIINKEIKSLSLSNGAKLWYKIFSSKHQISHHRLIRLDNQRVI
ncbi:MAG: hypothetical protein ACTS73_04805 [Arsenophonus sp. NEOnobi-MAG3]